uniref:Cytochrome c oxidase subunit 7A1, mitochondrial n=1 Tax=Stegastes partitus TaxID=144197 RepID=A0A3B5A0T6_9TELE
AAASSTCQVLNSTSAFSGATGFILLLVHHGARRSGRVTQRWSLRTSSSSVCLTFLLTVWPLQRIVVWLRFNSSDSVSASPAASPSACPCQGEAIDMNHLLADNSLPVHIKGGTGDVLLYRATMTLTMAGTCYSLYWLLFASMPQKKA